MKIFKGDTTRHNTTVRKTTKAKLPKTTEPITHPIFKPLGINEAQFFLPIPPRLVQMSVHLGTVKSCSPLVSQGYLYTLEPGSDQSEIGTS